MAVTDYLMGTGTSTDPYIIHNAQAAAAFFNTVAPCFKTNAYFSVVADIDCSSFQTASVVASTSNHQWMANLYGNGHSLSNIYVPNTGFCFLSTDLYGVIESITLHFSRCASSAFAYTSSTSNKWKSLKNCKIICDTGSFNMRGSLYSTSVNVITNQTSFIATPIDAVSNTTYIYAENPISSPDFTGGVILIGTNRFIPANYPTLSENYWSMDGLSLPKLVPEGRPDLTQRYAIKGATKVGGTGKSRDIVLFAAAYMGILTKLKSNPDGSYLINNGEIYDPVMIIHYDDYGFPLSANTAYVLGAYIHPKIPNGYRYKCTTAGTSAGTLPTGPWPTSSNLISGTAIFSPEPVYAAETFLVSPHLYDFLTGQPV